MASLIRWHHLRMPSNPALLIKTITMEEGLVMLLDPDFDFASAMAPFARKVWDETYSPQTIGRKLAHSLNELFFVGLSAPGHIRRILGQVSRGELTTVTNQTRLDEELAQVNSIVNRLIFAIALAATIVSAILMLSSSRSTIASEKNPRNA